MSSFESGDYNKGLVLIGEFYGVSVINNWCGKIYLLLVIFDVFEVVDS